MDFSKKNKQTTENLNQIQNNEKQIYDDNERKSSTKTLFKKVFRLKKCYIKKKS